MCNMLTVSGATPSADAFGQRLCAYGVVWGAYGVLRGGLSQVALSQVALRFSDHHSKMKFDEVLVTELSLTIAVFP